MYDTYIIFHLRYLYYHTLLASVDVLRDRPIVPRGIPPAHATSAAAAAAAARANDADGSAAVVVVVVVVVVGRDGSADDEEVDTFLEAASGDPGPARPSPVPPPSDPALVRCA